MDRMQRDPFPLPPSLGDSRGAPSPPKIVSLIVRRPDLERDAFAEYYDDHHAPLALDVLPAPFASYRRNHVVDPANAPFDCLSEFRFPDGQAMERIFAYLQSEASRVVHEDEARFMDRVRNVFFTVREEIIRARPNDLGDHAVGIWALSEGEPVTRDAAAACIHNHVGPASREDGPKWAVMTELWYPDEDSWDRDRSAWSPRDRATLVIRIRESVSVPDLR